MKVKSGRRSSVHLFKFIWRLIAQGRMDPFGIVEKLNVLEQRFLGIFSRNILGLINELTLKNTVKGLDTSVVVTVSFSAHASYHLVLFQ